jgi:hypothetical protein
MSRRRQLAALRQRPNWRGSPQLLVLRRLPPREPAIQAAHALTQRGPLNTELSSAGSSAFQAGVPLTSGLLHMPDVLRGWPLTGLPVHGGLLICAIRSDARCPGVMVTVSPKQPSATISHDLLILSDLHPHPLPARSGNLNTRAAEGWELSSGYQHTA